MLPFDLNKPSPGFGRFVRRVMEDAAVPVTADAGQPPRLTVETIDNHIYFYADVDSDRCLAMIRAIRELDTRLRNERGSRGLPADFPLTPIWLHVQSDGGGLFAGLAMADQLAQIESPIYSIVEGVCASAATLIALSCTRRYILPSAFMLVHQLSSFKWGKYEEFKDEMVLLDMAMARLVAFYEKRTRLQEADIREMLKRDTWMDAQTCLELGFVDEIA